MQETRRTILEILRRRRQATVDEIVEDLQQRRGSITAVTVRHHLKLLQDDELITTAELKRRTSPGRPQYVYTLTEKALEYFPNNYQQLAEGLLEQLRKQLPPAGVNVILEGVADQMAGDACIPGGNLSERLDAAVGYLTERGYEARWEQSADGYVLYTSNCPYHHITEGNPMLCDLDLRLVSSLLSVVPRRIAHMTEGGDSCSYLIPEAHATKTN
ncbi:MAG TPA: ArsR family transcriptional regulator [Phototrophicaceae bacterium]|nr:ArsR family transcriptional regulator [Phototrophicaceae bacterium]